MNLRPLTMELLDHCVKNDFCTNCTLRAGCPIRYRFYKFKDELEFEIQLQTLELQLAHSCGESIAFLGTIQVRNKYTLEKRNNPYFSYL